MKIKLAIRSKTNAYLDTLEPEHRKNLLDYIESFITLSVEEAFKKMVKIKISPEEVLYNNKNLDETDLKKISGDICINYQKLHYVSWLSDEDYPSDLKKALGDDKTLLALIKRRVRRRVDSPKYLDLRRLQFLLNSTIEKYRFGGLRELKFTEKEARFFINKTIEISRYVEACYSKNFDLKAPIAKSSELNSINEVHEETALEPITNTLKQLSAADIVINADIIQNFLDAYDVLEEESKKLAELGFDCEVVKKNAVNIKVLLKAAETI